MVKRILQGWHSVQGVKVKYKYICCLRNAVFLWPLSAVFLPRFGFRTDAPNGRRGRRQPTSSAHRARCSRPRACHSSPPRPPWRTASARSTPTTRAGQRGCRGSPSFSSRRPWAASPAWRSRCHSAVWVRAPRRTQWVCQTGCPPTVRGCSLTSTSRLSRGCRPLCPVPRTYQAPRSCVAPRTVTCGEGQASRLWGAKRWSTQCPWVSLSDSSFCFHSCCLDEKPQIEAWNAANTETNVTQ